MYPSNVYLDIAHQRLLHATSDEVPAEPHDAPAQNHHALQRLPQEQLLPREDQASAPRYAWAAQPDITAVSAYDLAYPQSLAQWQAYPASQQPVSEQGERYLPSEQLHGSHLLLQNEPRGYGVSIADQRQFVSHDSYFDEFPPEFYNFQPNAQLYPTSSPSFSAVRLSEHVDGAGSVYGDRADQCQSQYGWNQTQHPNYEPQPLANINPYLLAPTPQNTFPPQFPQPRRAYSAALHRDHSQSVPLPVLQQWYLDSFPEAKVPSARQDAADALGKTGISSQRQIDDATKRKQDVYRQKGEARRKTIAAGMTGRPSISNTTLTPERGADKSTEGANKRRKVVPKPGRAKTTPDPAIIITTPAQESHTNQPFTSNLPHPAVELPSTPSPPPPPPPPQADTLPQPIVTNHANYKWSIKHYTLLTRGFSHAEPWLHSLLHGALYPSYKTRHFHHLTRGFIEHGTPLSLVVLHNATNPFSYPPAAPTTATTTTTAPATVTATVTIGVYGLHWSLHNAINWTTLSTDARDLFTQCVEAGHLRECRTWSPLSGDAFERRFHRAYWLAANLRGLGGLLNRSAVGVGVGGDVLGGGGDVQDGFIVEKSEEDPDEGFCVEEGDLVLGWGGGGGGGGGGEGWRVDGEEGSHADGESGDDDVWRGTLKEVEEGDAGGGGEGCEHLVLGSLE